MFDLLGVLILFFLRPNINSNFLGTSNGVYAENSIFVFSLHFHKNLILFATLNSLYVQDFIGLKLEFRL